mmetsp:Transcript_2185/g.5076  ORF Transcript_2185/g.5076 Transcript_2185/m.5076 type:complete len:203 (-) Transcript_2185:792-1400(-)
MSSGCSSRLCCTCRCARSLTPFPASPRCSRRLQLARSFATASAPSSCSALSASSTSARRRPTKTEESARTPSAPSMLLLRSSCCRCAQSCSIAATVDAPCGPMPLLRRLTVERQRGGSCQSAIHISCSSETKPCSSLQSDAPRNDSFALFCRTSPRLTAPSAPMPGFSLTSKCVKSVLGSRFAKTRNPRPLNAFLLNRRWVS